jgi:sugar lactone lactonase YvrE
MLDRIGNQPRRLCAADGWKIDTMLAPAHLIGANGMRLGADNRLYVAQAFGSQISAVNIDDATVDIISPADGEIVSPDDLAFDSRGNLFATEVMSARVSAIRPNGTIDVIASDVPVANGVTVHNDRIFMSEFRADGRIMELFADGAPPKVVATGLVAPNALSMGPDGYLYFPLVPMGEVWRVTAEGGEAEKVAGGFDLPTAVKFDTDGTLVVVESGSGAVTRFDPVSGTKTQIAKVAFGIDNLELVPGKGIFVSHFTDGGIVRIDAGGAAETCLRGAMLGPFGMTVSKNGELIVADGMSIATVAPDGQVGRLAMLLQHGFPGYIRNVVEEADGALICTNSAGDVARYRPGGEAEMIATGLDTLMGLVTDSDGSWLVCESGTGRVLRIDGKAELEVVADGLDKPAGIAIGADGTLFVSEIGSGRLVAIVDGKPQVLHTGMIEPHGVAVVGDTVMVLDRTAGKLIGVTAGTATVLASGLPTGGGVGRRINTPPGIAGLMPGPLSAFADLAVLADGRVCIGCDGNGSILTLSQHS